MNGNTRISNLHCKFAEKTWNDTFQLVRRCMEKSRDESKPCEPLGRSLERLQEVLLAPSMSKMKCRLEMIAKQQGMGFHFTDATCYLTADLFYLEVSLLPSGEVQEVKVAPHGEHPVPSDSLLHLLRSGNFADFSVRLAELFARYDIPGDNETKPKLLTSLKSLWKDLQQISEMPNEPKCYETWTALINSGRVGFLMAGKPDYPLSLYFYISPNDGPKNCDSNSDFLALKELSEFRAAVQEAQVTVGASALTHELQTTSVIPQPPRLDNQGCPAFVALAEVPTGMLPACFLLRLKPPIPVLSSFVERLGHITDVTVPDFGLQWAPLPKLVIKASATANSQSRPLDKQIFTLLLADGGVHAYFLPESAWDVPTQRAALMDSVPFTHPAHVPAVLELLRHQCAVNTLLRSCSDPHGTGSPASVCDLYFEVRPESTTSLSVTFHQPRADSLAVLLVDVSNPRRVTCKLFGAWIPDPTLDKYVSTVMTSCMSIPATMKALYSRLEEIATAPLSTSHTAARS